jgi:long-chain fatty acid transport protein
MKLQLFFVSLVICTFSSSFATHGTRMVGFDARTVGRGGTGIGLFDSPSLMMTNPAGISFLKSPSLDANFSLLIPAVRFSNTLNNEEVGETNHYPLPGVSYVSTEGGEPLSWGIGLFTQGGMGADFTLNHDLFRDQNGVLIPQKYHSKLAVMQVGPSFAYRVTDDFAVGISAHLVFSQLEFTMPYSLSPSVLEGVMNPGNGMTFGDLFAAPPLQGGFGYSEVTAAAEMSNLIAFGFNGKLGVAYAVSEQLTFGASYSAPVPLTYKGGSALMDMSAQLNDAFGLAVQGYLAQNPGASAEEAQRAVAQQFGQMGIDLASGVEAEYDLDVDLTFPQMVGLGVSFSPTAPLRLALDMEWIDWSSAFDQMSLKLSNGDNTNINRMLGNNGSLNIDFPMRWKDEMAIRIGGEFDLSNAVTVRAGYAFGDNPVPEESVFPVFPAIVKHHLMFGGSYEISSVLRIHGAYEMGLGEKCQASSQSIVADEFSNSVCELSEDIFHLSFSWLLN